jgi:hypothetical protein
MNDFSSDYIKVNEAGIDLLRSRFAYKHIAYDQIQRIELTDGYLLKNRLVTLMFGMLLLFIAGKIMISEFPLLSDFLSFHMTRGFAMIMIAPLFFIAFGTYCLLQSFKRSKILVIKTDSDTHHVRVYDIQKQLNEMITFLEKRVKLEILTKCN